MIQQARLRLLAYVAAVLALVLLCTGAVVYIVLTRQLDEAVDEQLKALAVPAAARIGLLGDPPEVLPGDAWVVRLAGNRELGRSESTPAGLPDAAALAAARSTGREDIRTITTGGIHYRVLTLSTQGRGPGPGATVQVGLSLRERERQQLVVMLALGGGGGLGLALTVLGAFFLTGRALAPIEASIARQRRFVSDASHELRTPLALLRLELESQPETQPSDRRPLLRQVDRLAGLIDDLLLLARLDESALPLEQEPLTVAALLRTASDEARRLAPEAHVTVEAEGDLWVNADPSRLHQVLLVLVDNAARVTPPGAPLVLRARRDHADVVITVTDGGPGIEAAHAGRVFERFYRVDKARARVTGGVGLGLPIASDIVKAHGGTLRLANPGQPGAIFQVRLPWLDIETVTALEPLEPAVE